MKYVFMSTPIPKTFYTIFWNEKQQDMLGKPSSPSHPLQLTGFHTGFFFGGGGEGNVYASGEPPVIAAL